MKSRGAEIIVPIFNYADADEALAAECSSRRNWTPIRTWFEFTLRSNSFAQFNLRVPGFGRMSLRRRTLELPRQENPRRRRIAANPIVPKIVSPFTENQSQGSDGNRQGDSWSDRNCNLLVQARTGFNRATPSRLEQFRVQNS